MDYKQKYLKYKNKYLQLKSQYGGKNCLEFGFQQHSGECWHDALSMLMMQSDLTSDEFIESITTLNLDEKQAQLEEMFLKNLDKNAYLLPFSFYIYYLNNKDIPDNKISVIINEFLRLSKIYISNHKNRVINRIQNDPEMSRYKLFPTKKTIKEDKIQAEKLLQQMEAYKPMNPHMVLPPKEFIANQLTDKQRNDYYIDSQNATRQIRLKRRDSFTSSYVCTTTITDIYNLITAKKREQRQGGNYYMTVIAYEILLLYLRKPTSRFYLSFNSFSFSLDIANRLKIKRTLKLLESDNLIGVDVSVGVDEPSDHAISLYKCDNSYKLYDDNVPYGVLNANWKKSLIDALTNILLNKPSNLGYPLSKSALETYGLQNITEEKRTELKRLYRDILTSDSINMALDNIDQIKATAAEMSITFDIKEYVESGDLDQNIKQVEEIYFNIYNKLGSINPQFVMNLMPPPIIDNLIEHNYKINMASVDGLLFVLKNQFKYDDDRECEYILNKLDILYKNDLFERLFSIKKITQENCKEKLLELLKKYYHSFDFKFMYYIVLYFNKEKEVISSIDEDMLLNKLVEYNADVLNNDSYVRYITEDKRSVQFLIKLYLMNTPKSEEILDSIDSVTFDLLLEKLDDLIKFDPMFLSELYKLNIRNFTNSKYKELLMKRMIKV